MGAVGGGGGEHLGHPASGLGEVQRRHHPPPLHIGRTAHPGPQRRPAIPEGRRWSWRRTRWRSTCTLPGALPPATSSSPPHAHGFKDFYIHETEQADLMGAGYPIGYLAAASSATEKVSASVSTVVAVGAAGMGGVAGPARRGAETRPRNMKVIYVIRVW